ncbi:unnamed protein product [Vitrella brassicaformis CCMP3155]|uniref:CP-type G domain-containing protein n=3 Tax=Vitrella brassicaformis TaxID=1169539 RepID=A0A0G4F7E6_VITBC|nr:unnamed protein product [Vitrella brassicaformis CCMP3155]|eukprot:CEM08633.1 unnamed protein product [Vitrella brassicaformis CCMP3155]
MPKPQGKKSGSSGALGKALVRDKERRAIDSRAAGKHSLDLNLHSTSATGGTKNLKSIIERNALDEYLESVLAQKEEHEVEVHRSTMVVSLDHPQQHPRAAPKGRLYGGVSEISVPIPRRPMNFLKRHQQQASDAADHPPPDSQAAAAEPLPAPHANGDDREDDDVFDDEYVDESDIDGGDLGGDEGLDGASEGEEGEDAHDEDESEDDEPSEDADAAADSPTNAAKDQVATASSPPSQPAQPPYPAPGPRYPQSRHTPRRRKDSKGPKEGSGGISAAELDRLEQQSFLSWRRRLAHIEEAQGQVMTPYEKNIEVWRQLWRVIERSRIVLQICDARHPLFYRCGDLEKYVKEMNTGKHSLLVLNKADFLSRDIRRQWVHYFQKQGVPVIFFSALRELRRSGLSVKDDPARLHHPSSSPSPGAGPSNHPQPLAPSDQFLADLDLDINTGYGNLEDEVYVGDGTDVLSCEQLLQYLKTWVAGLRKEDMGGREGGAAEEEMYTVGMVGYPNVGKSSLINALVKAKRVAVSRTPGKTKHFQTFHLPAYQIIICDCPGLVFPSIVASKAALVINGVLPVESLRGDFLPPVQLVCDKITPELLATYLPEALPTRDQDSSDTHQQQGGRHLAAHQPMLDALQRSFLRTGRVDAQTFLTALAHVRGYHSGGKGGQPDLFRTARMVVQHFCTGKLRHVEMPPSAESGWRGLAEGEDGGRDVADNEGDDDDGLLAIVKEREQLGLGRGEDADGDDIEEGLDSEVGSQMGQLQMPKGMTKRKMRFLKKSSLKGGKGRVQLPS